MHKLSKSLIPLLVLLSAAMMSLPARAQVIVSYVGSSSGGTMPGSATDFFFPNQSNYPGQPSFTSNQGGNTTYSHLTSFSIVGGVNGVNGGGSYSSIVTPAGGPAILTGDIEATGNPAPSMAFEPGLAGSLSTDGSYNSHFNYNDFNVYLMYSNTGSISHTDLSVTLSPILLTGPSAGTSANVLLDGIQAPLDINTNTATADYLEFNVQGLGTAMQSFNNLAFVVTNSNTGDLSYIGAISFQSVAEAPEPGTWALMLGGVGALVFVRRFRCKLS
jgi:hypothetical protein